VSATHSSRPSSGHRVTLEDDLRRKLGRPLRVLHLPVNVASQASASVRGLRSRRVDARGVVRSSGSHYNDDQALSTYLITGTAPLNRLRFYLDVLRSVVWADVVHWHFAVTALPFALDLKLARWLSKARVVEFWGSDIRIAAMEAADNPWFAARGTDYEYEAMETQKGSWSRQEAFSRNGVRTCLVTAPAARFLKPGAFDRVVWTRTRVVLDDLHPRVPTASSAPVVVVHSPSAVGAKGTDAVLAAVEQVRMRHQFDFRLVHGMSRQENLAVVAECDLFLDQFVEGTTYGAAAVEAMAMGKPVVCWIKPSALATFPPGLPVVVAAQDDLPAVLEELVADRKRLPELGRRSRQWAERHHDATYRAGRLVELYDELLREMAKR
jgi:glycosyltransferase involved in cell wall biosynthesis